MESPNRCGTNSLNSWNRKALMSYVHRTFYVQSIRESMLYKIVRVSPCVDFILRPHSSPENSMFELSRWAAEILSETKLGQVSITGQTEIGGSTSGLPFRSDPVRDPIKRASSLAGNRFLQAKSSPLTARPSFPPYTNATPPKSTPSSPIFRPSSRPRVTPIGGDHDYSKWSMISLKQQCTEWGLPKTGNKEDLITRLNGPRPPKVFMQRKAAKQYTPDRHDIGANALLVWLVLQQCPGGRIDEAFRGTTKDPL